MVKQRYGDNVSITWKSFPLLLDYVPGRSITPHSAEARDRASTEEDVFRPWDDNKPYPSSSLPAQIAGKCALRQGIGKFERYHEAVFRAFFRACKDISDIVVLTSLGTDTGLDIGRFRTDYGNSSLEDEVLAEFEEAKKEFEGWGIPLVIFDGRFPLAGAVPVEMYYRAVDLCLA